MDEVFSVIPCKLSEFRPQPGYALVRRDPRAEKVGGIYLPSKTEEERRKSVLPGRVIKIGGPYKSEKTGAVTPMEMGRGDRVIVRKYAGHDVIIEGQKYVLMQDGDALAVVADDLEIEQAA